MCGAIWQKNPQTGRATWELAEAHYELIQFEDTSWLIRKELSSLQGSKPTIRTDVVFYGATDFSFDLDGAMTRVHLNQPNETKLEGPQPLGQRIQFAIYSQNNEQPSYEYTHQNW